MTTTTTTAADLRAMAVSFASMVSLGGDSEAVSVEVVADLAVAAKALSGAAAVLARRVACSDAWRASGHGSSSDWFASLAGCSVSEARRQIDTAKRLSKLPATAAAMAAGELSASQARFVTEAAAADPSAEDYLLSSARTDTHQTLRDKAARIESAAMDPNDREPKVRRERTKRLRFNADGSYDLHLHGPGIDGIRLRSRLRPYEEQIFATGRRDGTHDTYDNRCYDAFFNFLADLDDGLHPPANGVEPTAERATDPVPVEDRFWPVPTPSGADPTRRPKGGHNIKIIVRIDHSALARGHTIAGETCDADGEPITVDTVKQLLPDAFLAAVITKGRDVINVAHLGRGCNPHQRTALEWTGIRCSNQACNHTIAIQIDHREPWTDNPVTKLDNQDPLCPDCHRKKTHHGWTLTPGTGPRPFQPPPPTPTHSPTPARC